jgi:hypothetical protein
MSASDAPSGDSTKPSAAQHASSRAEAEAAHQAWVQLTTTEPSNQDAWIGRASAARDLHDRIASLNRALELNPANGFARRALHDSMQQLLGRDVRLVYGGETSTLYQLRTAAEFEFTHPKDRVALEPYPAPSQTPVQAVYPWLKWAMIGLIPAGLGTLIFAPVAIVVAIMQLQRPLGASDRRRMWVTTLWGAVLWLAALALGFILALHLS